MNRLEAGCNEKLEQWAIEDMWHFCHLVRKPEFTITVVEYPTGLRMARVVSGSERAEVPYATYCRLSSDNFTIRH